MKIEPTAEGDLKLHLEMPIEWLLLLSVLHDTESGGFDLAERVGGAAAEVCEDWRELVLPELRERFGSERRVVETALAAGRRAGFATPHSLTIPRRDFSAWYALFNHARLALEARWNFGPNPQERAGGQGAEEFNAALLRAQLYQVIQVQLLDLGLD
ncbi:MAG: hypothetical protein MUF04_03015 [Akkermansiaceae bacterium]|jgi:hypothetical protein|nr:hypothetical protein [Akkermansiaceae bacterium]